MVLAWIGDELWCSQAQNWVNLDFQFKFNLEDHGQSLHKTIRILSKVFYTSDPNLVILAWMDHNGSRLIVETSKQFRQRDTHTCRQRQYPKAKTSLGQKVKILRMLVIFKWTFGNRRHGHGHTFSIIGPLCGESTWGRWIHHTRTSNVELWCFHCSWPGTSCWTNSKVAADLRCHDNDVTSL